MTIKNSSFEIKILKQSCLILSVSALGATINNVLLDLQIFITIITAILTVSNFVLWALLKKERNFRIVRIIFTAFIIVFINIGWYYNYTSEGPVLLLYLLICVALTFIWPVKTSIYMGAFFVLNISLLLWLDMKHSEEFLKYPSEQARILDVYLTAIAAIIVGYFFSRFAKSNYIKKYNEAKRSDEMKTSFLQNMSHELRTPLNAIIGFSDIGDEDSSKEELIAYNKIINSNGNHLLSIINDLMDISLIESGDIRIENELVDLNQLFSELNEISQIDRKQSKRDEVAIKFIPYKEDLNYKILTDRTKLKQILINLLKNALKFTPKGYINFGYTIDKSLENNFVKFFVKDSGIGIEDRDKEMVFNIFKQVEGPLSKVYGGTGIGLSISKKLTELLGGRIWVESIPNKGSNFYFTLPLSGSEFKPIEQSLNHERESIGRLNVNVKPKKNVILIVEDYRASYEFLKVLLTEMGMDTVWAENGKKAIELCKENENISLVLMDINLPVLNGYEATKQIKIFKPNLPIIAQTAYAISGDREKSISAGCDDYITKPIKKDILKNIILKYLESNN